MDKIIFFENDIANRNMTRCIGQVYKNFLDYAFERTDYFMMVYINWYGKGYTTFQKTVKKQLDPYKIKSRSNPSWPGTLGTWSKNTTYKVVFYRNVPEAKEILLCVNGMNEWSANYGPEDLAFFEGNQCWFYSVGHEGIAAILHANEKDLDFVESNGLSDRRLAKNYSTWYDSFNEDLERYAEKHKK